MDLGRGSVGRHEARSIKLSFKCGSRPFGIRRPEQVKSLRTNVLPPSFIWPFPLPSLTASPKFASDAMPFALLEAFGITPRPILFGIGHLLSMLAVLGDHIVSQSFNVIYWDQPGANTQLPCVPEKTAPQRGEAYHP